MRSGDKHAPIVLGGGSKISERCSWGLPNSKAKVRSFGGCASLQFCSAPTIFSIFSISQISLSARNLLRMDN
jgi:hypothetical protein